MMVCQLAWTPAIEPALWKENLKRLLIIDMKMFVNKYYHTAKACIKCNNFEI